MSEATSGAGDITHDRSLSGSEKGELEQRWLEDNREAIVHYNRRVAEHGLLSDDAGLL
jgi:post-segregation antitoxin (ccd killing protein)